MKLTTMSVLAIIIISTLMLFLASGCAPMPNGVKLFPGVTHLTPLSWMELEIHEVSLGEALWQCNKIAWEVNPLLPILALGMIPSCGRAYHDGKGGIERCEVWVPKGDRYGMRHELRQCRGMADKWY